ncbi:hypothetical protein J2Z40_000139 [Cytobacillus eiseniae]|uniref:SH3b domain-containing protein n=1 Tax=Cytobacillus eiseniae TaxID=762947 RepID=A0ABS4R9M6_9BACI|nr:hypothetical protein [Cytobacillus eiseniae]MBP2239586.1 hypothetical protein [Cytobacillus eiseniae]
MKKVIFGLLLIFTMSTINFAVSLPTSAISMDGPEALVEDTIYVSGISTISSEDWIFYSMQYNGYLYRGYISKYYPGATGPAAYHGTLYRAPLPYPTPFIGQIESSEY